MEPRDTVLPFYNFSVVSLLGTGPIDLIYKAQFCLSVCLPVCVSVCLCVCFSSSETSTGTSIKLSTIDHHLVASVIRY